jgi:hypothetical protein
MTSRVWPGKRPWVIGVQGSKGSLRRWRVGTLTVKKPRQCAVLFNNGDGEHYRDPKRVLLISHPEPYILSGPYSPAQLKRLDVIINGSPLPPPVEIGQRVIAYKDFDEWYLGTIVDVRETTESRLPVIVVIHFDNGLKLGYPEVIREFWTISAEFSGEDEPYSRPRAMEIVDRFGLKVEGMRRSINPPTTKQAQVGWA